MVTITLHCPHCGSEALVRDGHAKTRVSRSIVVMPVAVAAARIPLPMSIRELRREEIVHASQERSSLRGLTRTDCASRAPPCRVGSKKSSSASPFPHDLGGPRPRGCCLYHPGTLSADGSFVLKKANDSWIWIALCRRTRKAGRICRWRSEPARRASGCGRPLRRSLIRAIV
jgi:hypothetical protein